MIKEVIKMVASTIIISLIIAIGAVALSYVLANTLCLFLIVCDLRDSGFEEREDELL